MQNFPDNRMVVFIVILAIGSISGVVSAQVVMGSDGDTLKNLLGGCIYGACKDTKITGNFTNGTLAGCVFGACKNVQIKGESSQPTPTATLIVTKVVVNCGNLPPCIPPNFQIKISGVTASPNPFPGNAEGTHVTVSPGKYTVSETGPANADFTTSFSDACKDKGDGTASGTIVAGEIQKCTITNTFTL